jgi:hypothetical protein
VWWQFHHFSNNKINNITHRSIIIEFFHIFQDLYKIKYNQILKKKGNGNTTSCLSGEAILKQTRAQ